MSSRGSVRTCPSEITTSYIKATVRLHQFRVLQGSVLGPILFIMYTAWTLHLVRDLGLHLNSDMSMDAHITLVVSLSLIHI